MSNRVSIVSNTFGFTVFDDYDRDFCVFEKADDITDPVEVVRLCVEGFDPASPGKDILNFVYDMQKGLLINDDWYDFEEIEEGFKSIPEGFKIIEEQIRGN